MNQTPVPIEAEPLTDAPSTSGMTLKVIRGSFWGFLGQVLPLSVTLIATPFIIRLLGAEAYGVLVLINLIPAYFGFADFGMSLGSTKFASDAYAAGARADEGKIVRTAALIALLTSLPFALGILIFASPIVEFLKIPEHLTAEAVIAFRIAAVTFVLTVLGTVLNTPQLTRMRMDLNLVVTAGCKVLAIALTVGALFSGWGLTGAVTAAAIGALLTVLGHFIVSGRLLPELFGFEIKREAIKPLLKFGGALVITAIAAILLGNLEKLVLTRLVSVKALAYYSVAFLFANLAAMFSTSMIQSLLPAFAQLLHPDKRDELNVLFVRCLRLNIIFILPGMIMMFIVARPFFTIWAGEDFGRESTLPFYILLAGMCLNLIAYIPHTLLIASGRTDLMAKMYWIELAPYIALTTLLTAYYGIAGAAAAWSIRVLFDSTILLYIARRTAGLTISLPGQNKRMLLTVLLLGSVPLLSAILFDNIILTFTIGAIFLITYSTMVWRFFITVEEKRFITSKIYGTAN